MARNVCIFGRHDARQSPESGVSRVGHGSEHWLSASRNEPVGHAGVRLTHGLHQLQRGTGDQPVGSIVVIGPVFRVEAPGVHDAAQDQATAP